MWRGRGDSVYHLGRGAVVLALGDKVCTLPRQFYDTGNGCSMLEYVLDSLWTVADELYVVFSSEPDLRLVEAIAPYGVKVIVDEGGVVSCMMSSLKACRSEHCMVAADNMPFLKPNVVFALFEAAKGYDAAVPRWPDGRVEHIPAVYRRKAFLKAASMRRRRMSVKEIVDDLYAVHFVDVERDLKPLDPELDSFFKVESEEDLAKASRLASVRQGGRA